MGLLTAYFVAPSDGDAASTIDRVGGPGQASPAPQVRRGLFRRSAAAAPVALAYPTFDGRGIEPVVQLGTLEALLTGRSFDDVLAAGAASEVIAQRDEGEALVVRLSQTLTAALAEASHEQLGALAEPWSQTEEFWGAAEPESLGEFLGELSGLARQAHDRGESVYCWLCV